MSDLNGTGDDAGGGVEWPLLRVAEVTTVLGGKVIVDSVSLDIWRGEVVGVVGSNGSGKTTLLKTIAGLLDAESGVVAVDGFSVVGVGSGHGGRLGFRDRARRLAYMPQRAESHPFTAFEAVLMGRYPHLGRFALEGSSDREMARAAMERTSTSEFADRKLDTLSGGERQRVVLARVLVQQADVLLMDEPTASLDLWHQMLTMDLMREETNRRGAGAIVVLHDLSLAARYCDRLVLLHKGRKIAEGTPWDVLTPENLRTAFGVEGLVEPDPVTGKPHVLLLGSHYSESSGLIGTGRTVHLICGAGSGRQLMHQLRVAGYTVTAGVLGTGDSDREAAERLGLDYVGAPPFSAITNEQHSRHLELVRAADHVVLCPMAVGINNMRNVEAALEARDLLVVEPPVSPGSETEVAGSVGDYTQGRASQLRRGLIERSGQVPEVAVLFELARAGSAATLSDR
ncbi:MAG: ABC transporter ATP-binding protein [Chloroflexi bacterium]|nr:ABC transporter ATP-binding protein [Chloroflexota bacterium]